MRNTFRGWRRIVGAFTLLVSLALMAAWLRSHQFSDELIICGTGQYEWRLGSLNDSLFFRYGHVIQSSNPSGGTASHRFRCVSKKRDPYRSQNPIDEWNDGSQSISPNHSLCGFRYAKITPGDAISNRFSLWLVPYWAVVLPLALFSGWSLVRKPRQERNGEGGRMKDELE